jgi:hypothetical protein
MHRFFETDDIQIGEAGVSIVDGHPVPKSKQIRESTGGKLRLCYLPGYSPELNSDETVWS